MLRDYLKTHTVDDLKLFFDTHHIKPHAFNAWIDINFLDEDKWNEKMDEFMLGCRVGSQINDPYYIVCPTVTYNKVTSDREVIIEDTVKNVLKLSDIAQDYGMKIAYEPVGIHTSYVQTVEMACEILERIDRDNVGICLDSSNLYLNHKLNDFQVIQKIPPEKIWVAHINDMDDLPIEQLDQDNRSLPGRGVIDLNNYIDNLEKAGYKGMVSVETFREEYWQMNGDDVIRMAYKETLPYIRP